MGKYDLLPPEVQRELQRCAHDFVYFAERWLQIPDRDTQKLGPWVLNAEQHAMVEALEESNYVIILKHRKGGASTCLAGYYFWKAMFNEGMGVAVVSNVKDSASVLYGMYKTFYSSLPDYWKVHFPTKQHNIKKLEFKHRSFIRVLSSHQPHAARGDTFTAIHSDEYATWSNVEEADTSLANAAVQGSPQVVVSTANGMNHFFRLWEREDGATRLFFPWTMDAGYQADDITPAIQKMLEEDPLAFKEHVAYSHEHHLTPLQYNWFINTFFGPKCKGSWNTWNQEYPITPMHSFIATGARFFKHVYPEGREVTGYRELQEPAATRTYAMGVDSASGAPKGDFSSFVILDISELDPTNIDNGGRVTTVARYYGREPLDQYAFRVFEACQRYKPICTVEVTGGWGAAVQQRVDGMGYGNFYVRTEPNIIGDGLTTKLGFDTRIRSREIMLTRLQAFLDNKRIVAFDTTAKYEANTFVHLTNSGRVDHEPGKHSDMLIAYGLALMGVDQAVIDSRDVNVRKPKGVKEILDWELLHGREFRPEEDFEDQSLDDWDEAPSIAMGSWFH